MIKCANCGKEFTNENIKLVSISKEKFYLCKKCEELTEKFKEKHKI